LKSCHWSSCHCRTQRTHGRAWWLSGGAEWAFQGPATAALSRHLTTDAACLQNTPSPPPQRNGSKSTPVAIFCSLPRWSNDPGSQNPVAPSGLAWRDAGQLVRGGASKKKRESHNGRGGRNLLDQETVPCVPITGGKISFGFAAMIGVAIVLPLALPLNEGNRAGDADLLGRWEQAAPGHVAYTSLSSGNLTCALQQLLSWLYSPPMQMSFIIGGFCPCCPTSPSSLLGETWLGFLDLDTCSDF
jgi:hypothetical protein